MKMNQNKLFISDGLTFNNHKEVLRHISQKLIKEKIVLPSHLEALQERETKFPTGIAFEDYAVAIPHCEVDHALIPAVYVIRLLKPVAFNRADENEMIDVSLTIGLVVTEPTEQLKLLKALFSRLQNKKFYEFLLNSSVDEIQQCFEQEIFC